MPKFEVISPDGGDAGRYTFSPAVKRGNLLFISGQLGTDAEGTLAGDIVGQTRRIFEQLRAILEAAGGSLDDIVQTTDYVTTLDHYRDTAAVRREYFTNGFPAATGVVVKELVRPDALIEIDAIAVLDG